MLAAETGDVAAGGGEREAAIAQLRIAPCAWSSVCVVGAGGAGASPSSRLRSTSSIVDARQPMPTLSPTFSESVFGERAVIVQVAGPCSVVSVIEPSVNVATVPT